MKYLLIIFYSFNLFSQSAGPGIQPSWMNLAVEVNSATPTLNYAIPVVTEWATAKTYKVGEVVHSGSDKNWLFKVMKNHISTSVPSDLKLGNLLAVAPPLLATGVQAGGVVSLAGTTATVQAGTGFISTYGTADSAYPLITIVEWATQNITLPATGIYSLYINPSGVLTSVAGLIPAATAETNIGICIVDMNLRKEFDTKTYPTNPVGQIRNLAFFFGGMSKGLSYAATGLTLARSTFETFVWGTSNTNPYAPNTKTHIAKNPVNFYEYTQTGAVLPAIVKTTLRNDVYDLNGTLTTMGNNKWGFIRIYTSLAEEDYLMYSQAEYSTELEARTAATTASFIKPTELTLTKFSSWFVFQKSDANFADNPITVCEPFGCDKIGGGTANAGNVTGPASSVAGHLAVFADTTGKILIDGGAPAVMSDAMNAKILDLEKRIKALENK